MNPPPPSSSYLKMAIEVEKYLSKKTFPQTQLTWYFREKKCIEYVYDVFDWTQPLTLNLIQIYFIKFLLAFLSTLKNMLQMVWERIGHYLTMVIIICRWQEVVSDVSVLCGEEQSPVQSGSTKLFYKNCWQKQSTKPWKGTYKEGYLLKILEQEYICLNRSQCLNRNQNVRTWDLMFEQEF